MLNRGSSVVVRSSSGYSSRYSSGGAAMSGGGSGASLSPGGETQFCGAVVLNRADPVEIGGERRVGAGQAAGGGPRLQVQRFLDLAGGRRIAPLAHGLKLRRAGEQQRRPRATITAVRARGRDVTLLEIAPREDERRHDEQHGDVDRGVRDGHRQIAGRHRLAVNHARLHVELREVRQHPVEPARQPCRRRRIDDVLEVAQVAAEMADDDTDRR